MAQTRRGGSGSASDNPPRDPGADAQRRTCGCRRRSPAAGSTPPWPAPAVPAQSTIRVSASPMPADEWSRRPESPIRVTNPSHQSESQRESPIRMSDTGSFPGPPPGKPPVRPGRLTAREPAAAWTRSTLRRAGWLVDWADGRGRGLGGAGSRPLVQPCCMKH